MTATRTDFSTIELVRFLLARVGDAPASSISRARRQSWQLSRAPSAPTSTGP